MLQIALLGPLEVSRDGEPLPVPGGKTTELLVGLALDAGVLCGPSGSSTTSGPIWR